MLGALAQVWMVGTAMAGGLTDIAGIRVGHAVDPRRPTGVTAILVEAGAVAGVDVRGSAPGTRETDLLAPTALVEKIHALVLAGGSAFGLDAATGVVRYLEERGVGFRMGATVIPIVPAAILYDLNVGDPSVRPDAALGYRAAQAATSGPIAEGSVGAGAGATVGKLVGFDHAMRGGLGTASRRLPDGRLLAALAVVNAVGNVVDPSHGTIVAGARDGAAWADLDRVLTGGAGQSQPAGSNTTLVVVATDAKLTKIQTTKLAQMAQDGLARAIRPAHTMYDGDLVFALSTGARSEPADLTALGAIAADLVTEAILRGCRLATSLPGIPAVADFHSSQTQPDQ
jgi:L-aminopeptidase/D-esterase-like protein